MEGGQAKPCAWQVACLLDNWMSCAHFTEVDTGAQRGWSLSAWEPMIRVTLGSYPVEIQSPSRRGGSTAVIGAWLGRGCWQWGSQRRWLPSATAAASVVQAAKQTDLG